MPSRFCHRELHQWWHRQQTWCGTFIFLCVFFFSSSLFCCLFFIVSVNIYWEQLIKKNVWGNYCNAFVHLLQIQTFPNLLLLILLLLAVSVLFFIFRGKQVWGEANATEFVNYLAVSAGTFLCGFDFSQSELVQIPPPPPTHPFFLPLPPKKALGQCLRTASRNLDMVGDDTIQELTDYYKKTVSISFIDAYSCG